MNELDNTLPIERLRECGLHAAADAVARAERNREGQGRRASFVAFEAAFDADDFARGWGA